MTVNVTKNNYVSNKELYEAICRWKQRCYDAGKQVKQCDTIGLAIMLISNNLVKRFNFSNYSADWKEEMVASGIEASVKGLFNFDETRFKNPHAYITTACFNAFVYRLKFEKKEAAKKYRLFFETVYDARDEEMASIADEVFIQDIYDKMQKYEESTKKPAPPKAEVLDKPNLAFLYDQTL